MFKFIKRISCFESRMDARNTLSPGFQTIHHLYWTAPFHVGRSLYMYHHCGPVPGVPVCLDVNGFIKCLTKKWIS